MFNKVSELRKSVFLFSLFRSKVAELQKVSYDVTICLNSVLWLHNPYLLTREIQIPFVRGKFSLNNFAN